MKLIDTGLIDIDKLPKNVKIATISITCALNADINIREIWTYFPLNEDIETIKFNKQIKSTDNTLIEKERKKLEKKLKKKQTTKNSTKKRNIGDNFYNCIIIVVNISPTKIINIKLFKNGSIQMTGSKNLKQTETALKIIIKYLKKKQYETINKKKVLVPFLLEQITKEEEKALKKKYPDIEERRLIRNQQKLDLRKLKLFKFNINMINTSFSLDFKIHLGELNKILECRNDCIVTYEASIHAGINIKIPRYSESDHNIFNEKIDKLKKQNEKILSTIEIIKSSKEKNEKSNELTNMLAINNKHIEKYTGLLDKKATILVFQSNDVKKMCNLIITGVTEVPHIIKAYDYINNIINDVKINIIKINVEELMEEERLRLEQEETLLSESYNSEDNNFNESVDSNNLFVRGG